MEQRWYGRRSSTRVTTDFDAAMASVQLAAPKGGFETREEARIALSRMIGDEMLQVAAFTSFNPESLKRLTAILLQLINDPAANAAEEGGLRFAIWPVDKPDSDVVTNVSDLSAAQQAGLRIVHNGVAPARPTALALQQRGFVYFSQGKGYLLTEAGKRALAALPPM